MHRTILTCYVASAFLLGSALAEPSDLAAQAQTNDVSAVAGRLEVEVQRILADTGIPAISIALVSEGEVAWTGASGFANVGGQAPATRNTYFSTGSTLKLVTATAVMQLVERGDLVLDDALNDVLDTELAVDGAGDVTIRHLLSHRSGLEGRSGVVRLWNRVTPRTPLELLARIARVGAPGEEYRYCNECFGIMAVVIQEASGQPYDEYVAEHILQPLGVDVTSASVPTPAIVEHLALPYDLEGNVAVPAMQVRYDAFAAGDVYLRPLDMGRFLAAHLNGGEHRGTRILSEQSTEETRRPQFGGSSYGLGIELARMNGREIIRHNGAIPGFNSVLIGEPATGHGVYIMSNAGQASRAITPLAELAMRLLWGNDAEPLPSFALGERREVELDPTVFDAYVGEYAVTPGFVLAVTRAGGRFFVQATGQPRFEIFAESETDFFLTEVDATVTFVRDVDEGSVTHLVLHQNGRDRRADRLPAR